MKIERELNQDCIRDLLLCVWELTAPNERGKVKLAHLKRMLKSERISKYTKEDIFISAQYIMDKGFAFMPGRTKATLPNNPRLYVFGGLTSQGMEYAKAVKDDTVWNKLKTKAVNLFEENISTIIGLAVSLF